MLWLQSIPAEVAKKAKKAFSKVPDISLWVAKPRKAEWLEENLNNPFRNWDGDEYIEPGHAKKAAKLYIDFIKQIKQTIDNPPNNLQSFFESLVLDFTLAFNKMDKKTHWIGTIEREHIGEVLSLLLTNISNAFEEKVDISKLEDIFEKTRDF